MFDLTIRFYDEQLEVRFRLPLLCRCLSRYAVASFAVFCSSLAHFCFFFLEAKALSAVDMNSTEEFFRFCLVPFI